MSLIAVLHCQPPNAHSQLVLKILEKQGVPYKAYESHQRWRRNYANKLRTAFQASQDLTEHTHILFLDAYDIAVIGTPEQIMERFQPFDHSWVCAAEPNFWPIKSPLKPEDYPPCESPWKYLNSGAYLAERFYLKDCFERWGIPDWCDDQWYLAEKFLHEPGCIQLDTNCELFQCLIGGWWAFESSPGRLHNNQTGTDPLILHNNGARQIIEERVRVVYEYLFQ